MLAVIRRNLTRQPITNATIYWVTLHALWHHAGMPTAWTGLVGAFVVGLPLYVWLFHMGKEEEPAYDG